MVLLHFKSQIAFHVSNFLLQMVFMNGLVMLIVVVLIVISVAAQINFRQ